jgi:hypothetical protein
MGIFMSIQYPHSVGKVHKILLFETVFHASASDCTKLTLTLAKQQVHSSYTDKKVHVGKGFGAGVATGLFGAKAVGRANAVTRNSIRHQELKAVEPYVEAERFISEVLAGLDKLKLELKAWIGAQRTK